MEAQLDYNNLIRDSLPIPCDGNTFKPLNYFLKMDLHTYIKKGHDDLSKSLLVKANCKLHWPNELL